MTEKRAKITREEGYRIYVQGQLTVFAAGEIVTGYIAEKALEDRAASAIFPATKKPAKKKAAPENKATKPAENKG